MTDKMREAFERDHGKLSANADMRDAWERNEHMMRWAWQAARTVPDDCVVVPIDAVKWLFGAHSDGFDWPASDRFKFGFRGEFARRAGLSIAEVIAAAPEPKK